MNSENMSERSSLINSDKKEARESLTPLLPACHYKLLNLLRLVSAEVVVFSFVFVFYYFQSYTQQYVFQWYAKEAVENSSHSPSNYTSFMCYNQNIINELSGSNSTINDVEAKAAHVNLMILLATYIPSLIVNLVIAPLSDKYGRKPAMILVLTGEALAVVLSVIITYLVLDIYWFILCGFLLGFSGGVSTLISVSFAYVSDVAPQRWRTVHLGFLQAVIYISIAISSGVFNVWLQGTNCDFRPPIWLMVAIVFGGLLYFLVLPETLPKEKRVQLNHSKKGITVLYQGVKIFLWPRLGYSLWRLWFVAFSIFIVVFGESGENAITTLFLLHKPLEWNRDLIGIYATLRSLSHGLALFLFLPLFSRLFSRWLKFPDPFIALIGIAITIGANIFLGFVVYTWEMFLGELFLILYCICNSFPNLIKSLIH